MKTDRDAEKTYALSEFVAELRRLADALESGETFTIDIDGEEISLPGNAVMSVEHERQDGAEEIEFQLKWGVDSEDDEDDEEEDEDESDAATEATGPATA